MTAWKLILGAFLVGMLSSAVPTYLYMFKHYTIIISNKDATIKAIDDSSKEEVRKWEMQNEESKVKYDADVTVLRNNISRLLRDKARKAASPDNPCTSNGATNEPASSGVFVTELVFTGCVLDAKKVMELQQWVVDKGVVVE